MYLSEINRPIPFPPSAPGRSARNRRPGRARKIELKQQK